MDIDLTEFNQEAANYIIGRAAAERSIPDYFEQHHADGETINEFIEKILALSDEHDNPYEDKTEVRKYPDKNEYISKKTGVSTDIAELVLWFRDCYIMSYDGIAAYSRCPACGHGKLYEKESKDGVLFEVYYTCVKCGHEISFDEFVELEEAGEAGEDDEDDEDYDIVIGRLINGLDSNKRLPLQPYKEPDPLEGLNPGGLPAITDKDAVYRFRVSRRIIELRGTDTLADFSYKIQAMYDLDSERMSSFYMGKKFFESSREIRCPSMATIMGPEVSTAENYEICSLNLYEKQKFLYLNDFMRENRFNITFIGIRR